MKGRPKSYTAEAILKVLQHGPSSLTTIEDKIGHDGNEVAHELTMLVGAFTVDCYVSSGTMFYRLARS